MVMHDDTNALIEQIERDGTHRVLRLLALREGETGLKPATDTISTGIVVDVETTGLDPATDTIIEFAARRFKYDESGQILKLDRSWSWREDPGRALDPDIVRLTGIVDADLVGREINERAATALLRSADIVVAHNAAFDRRFVETRLPGAAGASWCCSCREIDWVGGGFDGRGLGWLAAQAGWYFDAHRAENDVDAVIALLRHCMTDGRPALAQLIESAAAPSIRVEAVGADFQTKDWLRARGYRWNPENRVWWRDVRGEDQMDEEYWLGRHVYSPECRPKAMGPRLTELTARERYTPTCIRNGSFAPRE